MAERRVIQPCGGDYLIRECVDHASEVRLMHVDVQTYADGRYLGAWSLETQAAVDGLLLTPQLALCLEQLGYKDR